MHVALRKVLWSLGQKSLLFLVGECAAALHDEDTQTRQQQCENDI